jgi:hypothetical protein
MKDEKEDMEEGYNTPSYEEGDTDPMNEDFNLNLYNKFKTMNTPINEEFLRMQKLAGIITEGEYKRRLNESAGENLELKSLQKKAYSVLKGMGFDPKITSGEAGAGKTILSKQKYKANRGFALVNLDPKTGIFDVLITSTSLKRNKDNTATNLNPDQEANKVVDGLEKLIDKNKFEVGYKQTTDKGGSTYQIFVRAKSTGKKGGVMATESFLNEAVKLSDIMQGDKFKGGVSLVQNISYKNKEYLDAAKMTPSSIKKEEGNRDQLVLVKKGKAIEYGIDDGEVADLITYEEALKKL